MREMNVLAHEKYDRLYSDRALVRRILTYFRSHRRLMTFIIIAIIFSSLSSTAIPILMGYAIDLVVTQPTRLVFVLTPLGFAFFGLFGWLANYIHQRYTAVVVGDIVWQLRADVFDATIDHDLAFYDQQPVGKLVSRITADTQDFAETATLTLTLASQLLLIIILGSWLFTINLTLTLLLISIMPLIIIIALSFRRLARHVTAQARRITATINAQIQESIGGILIAKNFRQENALYDQFKQFNNQGYYHNLRRGFTLSAISPVVEFSIGLTTVILLYVGGLATRDTGLLGRFGTVTPGQWFLYMQSVRYFWRPMMSAATFWSQFQDGLAAAERIFSLIDADNHVTQTNTLPANLPGPIQFQNVRFSYTNRETVLPDFSLTIPPGQTVALVGHTGAGKSSIGRLLTRFYEFQDGHILINGQDIRALDLAHYRHQIGIVPQTPFLFSGTIADNLRYARPDATDEQLLAAARRINNGAWLTPLPHGLHTDVGERGDRLSRGQRQLVALVRVILKDPALFILDEATASVDPLTETHIQAGLQLLMQDRTAVVIAHRLSTIKNADRILVLDQGHIIEEGTHEQLLARANGRYADLYQTYFRHQSLEYIETQP
ncbi:MAG TPA: ABC transporter ATP-binding protein [Anaerolineae bacterium]|nr:ABC transporter ATP-binding protein [Anaerolineae bacterium]